MASYQDFLKLATEAPYLGEFKDHDELMLWIHVHAQALEKEFSWIKNGVEITASQLDIDEWYYHHSARTHIQKVRLASNTQVYSRIPNGNSINRGSYEMYEAGKIAFEIIADKTDATKKTVGICPAVYMDSWTTISSAFKSMYHGLKVTTWRKEHKPDSRPNWDEYFMMFAKVAASRSSCPRASCGAVIVDPVKHNILSTGYNGAPSGEDHCTDVGCLMEDGHCQRALHAEVNAIAHAAKSEVNVNGAVMYIYGRTASGGVKEVCRECAKVLKSANVTVAAVKGD